MASDPGAKRLAFKLRNVVDDVDGLVAGQLWVEIRNHGGTPAKALAMTILRNVERVIQAEHGIATSAHGWDKVWSRTRPSEVVGDSAAPVLPVSDPEGQRVAPAPAQREAQH